MGRWSRRIADGFVAWLDATPLLRWLDVGCGTGALSRAVAAGADPAAVADVDASAGYIAHARQRWPDPRVRFDVGDA